MTASMRIVCVVGFIAALASPLSADVMLFEDDFNDGVIDPTKWASTAGVNVVETGGVLQVNVNGTNNGGKVTSQLITLASPTELITMTRHMMIHKGSSEMRMHHEILRPGDVPGAAYAVRASYYDYHYQNNLVGFGTYNNRIASYDTWFDEVLTYDPVTGATHYTNTLGADNNWTSGILGGNQMKLYWSDTCWYTGHFAHVDSIAITQAPDPATMSVLAVGGLAMLIRRRKRR